MSKGSFCFPAVDSVLGETGSRETIPKINKNDVL